MSELTQFHVMKWETLRTERSNFDNLWEETAAFIVPSHINSFTGRGLDVANGAAGQKKTYHQYDSTAAISAQRFSSVMESLNTPQSSMWHRLVPADKTLKKNRAVRLFFDDLNDLLFSYRYRPAANFVGNSQQTYLGLGAYGNGGLFIDKPRDGSKGLWYRNYHLGEIYWVENAAGIVDGFYRSYHQTARQIIDEFGEAAPEPAKEAAKNPQQAEKKFEILHCVYPRKDADPRRVDPKGMPFASLYIFIQTKELISEGGYGSFPMASARYYQSPGEVYGRGPGQMVLAAIKVLNDEKKTVLKQGHRAVDPVLLAHDDGQLGNFSTKPGKLNPGGVSKEGRPLVHALPVGSIEVGDKLMEMEKIDIKAAFLIDLFQILIDSPQMTATEVLERAREKGMFIAPIAGRLQAEFLGRMIERELDLLFRQGLVPPLPPILRDAEAAEYKIEYDSPMSRMQRSEKAAGFMRALQVASEYAKMTGDVTPLDHFDFDVATPEILDIQGSPTGWTRSADAIKKLREGRAQAQQQAQMVEAAPAAASVISTMSKAKP